MKYAKLTIFVVTLLMVACDEATRPVAPHDSAELALADADLPELANAVSKGLADPAARHRILAAMRASHAVEHRLILADYLRSPEGADLLAGASRAFDADGDELLARLDRLRQVAEVVVAVPLREHRLKWSGSADIGVAGAWESDALGFVVHEPDGGRRRAGTVEVLESYDAFFLIRPQESWGTRIGRQPDGPGPVIQDPDDGEEAVVWTYQEEGKPPVSVDYGLYDSDEALAAALAEATSQPSVSADGEVGAHWNHADSSVNYSPTLLDRFLLRHSTEWGSEEVEIIVGYTNHHGARVQGKLRRTGVRERRWYWPRKNGQMIQMLPVSPKTNGPMFYVKAYETDWGPDDFLGSAPFWPGSPPLFYLSWWAIVGLSW